MRVGTRVVQRQFLGATEKVGIVGKLILQGLEILGLEWKGAYQTGEVIDAVFAQGHDAVADHAAALGGLARLIRSARQDSTVAIGRWPYGHSVRVRVAHCHIKILKCCLASWRFAGGRAWCACTSAGDMECTLPCCQA